MSGANVFLLLSLHLESMFFKTERKFLSDSPCSLVFDIPKQTLELFIILHLSFVNNYYWSENAISWTGRENYSLNFYIAG